MKAIKSLYLIVLSSWAYAAPQIVTLDDGREVQLNENFTWQYVTRHQEQPAPKDVFSDSADDAIVATTSIPMIPVIGATTFSLENTQEVVSAEHSSVMVELINPRYEGDALLLETIISNNGLQPIIKADIKIELYDLQGKLIFEDETSVFTSIKRLADTYLRPSQVKQGTIIKIPTAQQDQYQIKIAISKLDHRG